MIPRRILRPLMVALLTLMALTPLAGRPLPVHAATLAFAVTSTGDTHDATPGDGVCADASSQCTVRAAVEEANAQPPGSAITITIPTGIYALSLGALTLTHNTVTLAGAGAQTTILNGGGSRLLLVGTTAFAKIGGLTLTGGNAGTGTGGALTNLGVTILTGSAVVGNTAQNGGGIANGATGRLWVQQSVVVSDTAPNGSGGGIANQGALTINKSILRGNTAQVGGAIASTGTLTLTSSIVATNTATLPCCNTYGGGGIYSNGATTVISSTLSGNVTVNSDGGGINNDANGLLTVSNSTVSGNVAANGGGLHNSGGVIAVSDTTLSGNAATTVGYGGGIDNTSGVLTVSNSTLHGNRAITGGAINGGGGTVTIVNSTLSGNTASSGGGLFNHAVVSLIDVTVDANSNGLDNAPCCGATVTIALTGTIVANSTSGPNCFGPMTEIQGYNLDSGTSCGFNKPSDLTSTNPLLGPLADNGGSTETMALLPGSPAIDHAGTSANGCPATDQRGVTRPQGAACDIGAYEYVPTAG